MRFRERKALPSWVLLAAVLSIAWLAPALALAKPITTGWPEQNLPEWLRTRVMDVGLWQLLALVLLVSMGMVMQRLAHFAMATQLRRIIHSQAPQLDNSIAHGALPVSALLMAAVLAVGFPYLGFVEPIDDLAYVACRVLALLSGVWLFIRQADVLSGMLHAKNVLSKPLVRLVRRSIKSIIFVIGGIVCLQTLRVDVGALLAGLGLGGIAFALAAKETLANLFGSLVIFVDRPFQIGDWVVIGDVEGKVEDVGFRTTRIRTFYDSLVTMPNSKLVFTSIDNMGLRMYRRFKTEVRLHLHTPPRKLQAFVESLRAMVLAHPDTRKDKYQVHIHEFGESWLECMVYVFFRVPGWNDELRARHELILGILDVAKRLGVELAFPAHTLHIDSHYPSEGRRTAGDDRELSADELRRAIKAHGPGGELANERYNLTHGFFPRSQSVGGDVHDDDDDDAAGD